MITSFGDQLRIDTHTIHVPFNFGGGHGPSYIQRSSAAAFNLGSQGQVDTHSSRAPVYFRRQIQNVSHLGYAPVQLPDDQPSIDNHHFSVVGFKLGDQLIHDTHSALVPFSFGGHIRIDNHWRYAAIKPGHHTILDNHLPTVPVSLAHAISAALPRPKLRGLNLGGNQSRFDNQSRPVAVEQPKGRGNGTHI